MDLSQEERREGNAKIFNHVGYKRINNTNYFIAETENPDTKIHIDNAMYDVSWDWLMTLYKNIANTVDVKFKTNKMSGQLLTKFYELEQRVKGTHSIESVWRKLVEYIELKDKFKDESKTK